MDNWYVYILECGDGSYYTGITTNIEARIEKHNSGKGAKYTRSRLPVKLAHSEEHMTESSARKREIQIKKWRRGKKAALATQ